MWIHYNKKHKRRYIILKSLVLIGIASMLYLSIRLSGVTFPSLAASWSFGIGFISVIVVGALAYFNRIKFLFKIRSAGMLAIFLILLLLYQSIDALVWATGLVLIPLLIDDIFIETYFRFINVNHYWDQYKYRLYGKE